MGKATKTEKTQNGRKAEGAGRRKAVAVLSYKVQLDADYLRRRSGRLAESVRASVNRLDNPVDTETREELKPLLRMHRLIEASHQMLAMAESMAEDTIKKHGGLMRCLAGMEQSKSKRFYQVKRIRFAGEYLEDAIADGKDCLERPGTAQALLDIEEVLLDAGAAEEWFLMHLRRNRRENSQLKENNDASAKWNASVATPARPPRCVASKVT